ncbi:MAG: hypothetical protein N2513_05705 [Deltaproteobacteria bacterium]|nr:hypothetical protein [Deltaproteobacteria bacterium]
MKEEPKMFNVYLSPDIANLIYEEEKDALELLESTYGKKINIISKSDFSPDRFNIERVI